jgi:hypothetical protein
MHFHIVHSIGSFIFLIICLALVAFLLGLVGGIGLGQEPHVHSFFHFLNTPLNQVVR